MQRIILQEKKCLFCGSVLVRGFLESGREEGIGDFRKRKFCNHKCYTDFNTGSNHSNWKGGIKHRPDGYLRDTKDKYVHRKVMEECLGRELKHEEFVHHIDGNKGNNDVNNLELHTNSSHRKLEVCNQKRGLDGKFEK